MKEKQELLALNNQMALQIQSLKGSPLSDKSIENMMSPVEESTTSDVLFQRVSSTRNIFVHACSSFGVFIYTIRQLT